MSHVAGIYLWQRTQPTARKVAELPSLSFNEISDKFWKAIKDSLWHLRKFLIIESPLKTTKSAFLFHVKISFGSWDSYIFALMFRLRKKISKNAVVNFKIYSVTDWATNSYNTTYYLIFQELGYQVMKFFQLIKYSFRKIFFNILSENESPTLVSDLFLFLKKDLYKIKASGSYLIRNIFW